MKITLGISNTQASLLDIDVLKTQYLSRLSTVVNEELKSRTPVKTGNARRGWRENNTGGRKVENKVPYIERLNSGYSRQAPKGFVDQGITAAISKIDKEFTKK